MAANLVAAPVQALANEARVLANADAAYYSRTLIRLGIVLTVGGFAMGTVGYHAKAAATAAASNEVQVITNIATIFSNIQAPTFTPQATGTAPLSASVQGVQDFFGDAWSDAQAAGGDVAQIGAAMGTLAEDVADGLIDIAKAFLAFVTHFPDILWNGAVWGIGGAMADVLNWLFPWVVIMGVACLVIGAAIGIADRVWGSVAAPAWARSSGKWTARQEAKLEAGFDRLFGNFKHTTEVPVAPAPERQVASAPAVSDAPAPSVETPVSEPVEEGAAEHPTDLAPPPDRPEPVPEPTDPPVPAEMPKDPPVPAEMPKDPPVPAEMPKDPPVPAEISHETPPPLAQTPAEPPAGVMTKEEAEAYLGERPNRAPSQEEIQKMVDDAARSNQEAAGRRKKGVSGYEESRKAADAFAAAEAA